MSAVKYVQETPGGGDKSGDISVGALSPSESSERDDPDGRGQHEVVVRKSIIFPVKKKKGDFHHTSGVCSCVIHNLRHPYTSTLNISR